MWENLSACACGQTPPPRFTHTYTQAHDMNQTAIAYTTCTRRVPRCRWHLLIRSTTFTGLLTPMHPTCCYTQMFWLMPRNIWPHRGTRVHEIDLTAEVKCHFNFSVYICILPGGVNIRCATHYRLAISCVWLLFPLQSYSSPHCNHTGWTEVMTYIDKDDTNSRCSDRFGANS